MEEKEILNQLVNVADKSEKRVDKYIEITQKFLKGSPEWTEQHGTIFKEMLNEIQGARSAVNSTKTDLKNTEARLQAARNRTRQELTQALTEKTAAVQEPLRGVPIAWTSRTTCARAETG